MRVDDGDALLVAVGVSGGDVAQGDDARLVVLEDDAQPGDAPDAATLRERDGVGADESEPGPLPQHGAGSTAGLGVLVAVEPFEQPFPVLAAPLLQAEDFDAGEDAVQVALDLVQRDGDAAVPGADVEGHG